MDADPRSDELEMMACASILVYLSNVVMAAWMHNESWSFTFHVVPLAG